MKRAGFNPINIVQDIPEKCISGPWKRCYPEFHTFPFVRACFISLAFVLLYKIFTSFLCADYKHMHNYHFY